ncbi:hypothetical protein BWD42_04080 [Sphingobacterium sp. CZ-UAM]|uniref:hypothetical protein n=1 Tax=Sphingobacterium sp. CZ-UAM TaxID=1933868 RepID=UPI000986770E|nr:hypothetical protein [Sphingobacterium sp. CZ-UAM]OOG19136.1 hypothetical protein BWD42_04080 [Sphingobacterium sp. CZ-UAM]
MLTLDPTKLLDAIIDVKNRKFRNWETRLSRYGALSAFIDNTDLLLPKSLVENTRKSPGRPQKIPVLDKMNVEVIDKRSCNIVGNNGVSKLATLSWVTKGFEIVTAPAINAGNMISLEEDYAHQLLNGLIAVFAALDTAAANALELNKATSLAATDLATIAAGAYQMDINDIYFYMEAIMEKNDLYGPYLDVANTESIASWKKYWESFGLANEQNKAGVADRYVPYRSNRVNPGATNSEVHYFAAEGSIGIFNWNHWEAQNNVDFGNGTKVTIKEDPVQGLKWAVTEKTECRDLSATHGPGYEATMVKSEQWIADFSFVSAYSSDNKTPIIKAVVPKPTTP